MRPKNINDPSFMEERFRHLERDVAEIRTRINGLFFLVIGATLVQLLSKVTV